MKKIMITIWILFMVVDGVSAENMVLIHSGQFDMGDHHDTMSSSLPVHTVYVDSFYMSNYEVTNQQYCDYLNSALSQSLIELNNGFVYPTGGGAPYSAISATSFVEWNGSSFTVVSGKENNPVNRISWFGAAAYCNWRSYQEGKNPSYDLSTWQCDFSKDGYRLPTEAEWEYAARGGEYDPYYRFPWGDVLEESMANFWDSGDPFEMGDQPWTTPVGYYPANGYGLYDMTGNVNEWCNDLWSSIYYSTSPYGNPKGPDTGELRVIRGGSWDDTLPENRLAWRYGSWTGATQNYCGVNRGFRIAATPEPTTLLLLSLGVIILKKRTP